MNFKFRRSLPSTHTFLKENAAFPAMTMLYVFEQYGGRGQRGNSWESEPGKNLTFSFHYRPQGVPPLSQFSISEATALAVTDTLTAFNIKARIKWPNDIYVADSKICGILIDHSLCGTQITDTIVSAGLNVNQLRFLSDAPNPVSMAMVSGHDFDLTAVRSTLASALEKRLPMAAEEDSRKALHKEFMTRLWRGDGMPHPFRIMATGEQRNASIKDILPTGHIILQFEDLSAQAFAFKEIQFL
ncbi:MAG: biotin--[acetyl-CoA-carboxylase] ligase [Muribaculum sp.]|nr:biotin--[acetyl-CoA-carboxylase] ligase [Muribaculum sp.]